jgi:hypothetical protein
MRTVDLVKRLSRVDPGTRPALLAVLAVVLSVQPWRPLWNDEVLQYVFGVYSSTRLTWQVFQVTLDGINHSQTMAYIMLDHWLLRAFGASRFWLRLPSILATVLLFAVALRLWRQWGLSERWRSIGVLALYSSPAVMFHAGNARPYMPLMAATAAMLTFWSEPVSKRRAGTRLFGWAGMLTGALFHPYFAVYAAAVWALGFAGSGSRHTVREAARHLDVPLALTGGAVYVGTGLMSWMAHRLTQTYDPWFEIGRGMSAVRVFLEVHAGVLANGMGVWTGALVLVSLAVLAWRTGRSDARVAVLTLAAAVGLSLFLSWASWRSLYVIFPRQWAASAMLVALALPLLGRQVTDALPLRAGRAAVWGLFVGVGLLAAITALGHLRGYQTALAEYRGPVIRRSLADLEPRDRWILLANENTRQGGLVWPVFRQYYYLTGGGWEGFAER